MTSKIKLVVLLSKGCCRAWAIGIAPNDITANFLPHVHPVTSSSWFVLLAPCAVQDLVLSRDMSLKRSTSRSCSRMSPLDMNSNYTSFNFIHVHLSCATTQTYLLGYSSLQTFPDPNVVNCTPWRSLNSLNMSRDALEDEETQDFDTSVKRLKVMRPANVTNTFCIPCNPCAPKKLWVLILCQIFLGPIVIDMVSSPCPYFWHDTNLMPRKMHHCAQAAERVTLDKAKGQRQHDRHVPLKSDRITLESTESTYRTSGGLQFQRRYVWLRRQRSAQERLKWPDSQLDW